MINQLIEHELHATLDMRAEQKLTSLIASLQEGKQTNLKKNLHNLMINIFH